MRSSGAERFEGVEGPTMARHIFMCIYIRYTRAHVAFRTSHYTKLDARTYTTFSRCNVLNYMHSQNPRCSPPLNARVFCNASCLRGEREDSHRTSFTVPSCRRRANRSVWKSSSIIDILFSRSTEDIVVNHGRRLCIVKSPLFHPE